MLHALLPLIAKNAMNPLIFGTLQQIIVLQFVMEVHNIMIKQLRHALIVKFSIALFAMDLENNVMDVKMDITLCN